MGVLDPEKRSILSQAIWDLNLSAEELYGIIEGSIERRWPQRGFLVARLLESASWFDIVKIFEPERICALWGEAERHVRSRAIKEGMNFACRVLREGPLRDPG